MASVARITGSCHCGGVQATLETSRPVAELEVRACQCGFCTRQGARTISDPAGRAVIAYAPGALVRYQFATRTGTSLICRTCGVYVGVILEADGRAWSVLNARGLALAGLGERAAAAVSYEEETADARIARRMAKWTPTELRERAP